MRSAALIYNPFAGRQVVIRQLELLREAFAGAGFEVEALPTAGPGDATRLAREAAEAGTEVVFGAGGDGTQRELAEGLLGTGATLCPVPAGTTNVLAAALGLPPTPLGLVEALPELVERNLDVGLCGESPFLMMGSAGLDSRVMANQNQRLKALFGKTAVVAYGLRHWWQYGYPEIEVIADGRAYRATLAVVANIPLYGGPLTLVPEARFDDRRLDLILFRGRGRRATLSFAFDFVRRRHLTRTDVLHIPIASEVRFLGPEDLDIQLDGDLYPSSPPATFRLADERLTILAPPDHP